MNTGTEWRASAFRRFPTALAVATLSLGLVVDSARCEAPGPNLADSQTVPASEDVNAVARWNAIATETINSTVPSLAVTPEEQRPIWVIVAKSKGADTVAVFNVYANSPQGMYWLKSSGIKGVKDFVGKKIGNPAADGARVMWPALAKANGIDPKSVTWVNIDANAKLAALKAKSIDVTTSFYNIHHIFQRELGDDMGFLAWRDAGLNPYGNSVIVNAKYLEGNRATIDKFVKVTQRAFAACVKEPEPCVQALVDANGALKFDNELTNWKLVEVLMSDKHSREAALGIHDDARMTADYELVREYIGVEKPFDVKAVYTNEFLDRSIKMTK